MRSSCTSSEARLVVQFRISNDKGPLKHHRLQAGGLKIGHSTKLFSAPPEELNVCRTEATRRRTPAGCYVPVLTSGSRGHIAPLRGATLRRTFSTNIAHLRCALHRLKPVHCTATRCPTGFKPVVSAIPHERLA